MRLVDADELMRCIPAEEIVSRMVVASAKTIEPDCKWIPVSEKPPEDLAEVNVTWVNHIPEPYYDFLKDKPFTGSAVYYRGEWFWYSSTCVDVLAEYGTNDRDKVDDGIEITAWCEMPEPYKEEQNNAHRGSNDSHIRPY